MTTKEYYANHREQILATANKYYAEHREQQLISRKKYYSNHREQILATANKYYAEHREQCLAATNKWRSKHKEQELATLKKWKTEHKEQYFESVKKSSARRKRDYPSLYILNQKFEGSHLHHLTPEIMAYIPVAVHRAVPHNLRTGEGMQEINLYTMNQVLLGLCHPTTEFVHDEDCITEV